MKEYKAFIATNNNKMIDSTMSFDNKNLADECEDIERLLNSDYAMQERETAYGELHSITEITNSNTDEKEKLIIFQKETNAVVFNFKDNTESLEDILSDKEIEYINIFRKVIIDNENYIVKDILYNIDNQIVEVNLDKENKNA